MKCLKKCLTYITGHKDWVYSFDKPHQWKQDIKRTGKKIGYNIYYHTESFKLNKDLSAIQIYKTKRGTTHAVVIGFNLGHSFIKYNPYNIEDLTEQTGFLTVIKKLGKK